MTTWILLRGLTRERGHWAGVPELLQARCPGDLVVALDLPGNGALNQLDSPTRIETTTRWLRADVQRLGLLPPYRLLAMSMGAMVAIDWARTAPHEIAGCVLINTSVRPFAPWYRRLRPSSYAAILLGLLPGGSDEDRERSVLRLTSRNAEAAAQVVDAWVRLRRMRRVSARNAVRQLLAAARFEASPVAPATPLLVLASARDALVDVRCSQALAARWGASFALHAGAGHDLPLDDGPWVVEQVLQWLAATRQSAGAPAP